MKLERERDIAAFKGKSWREQLNLRIQAMERDPWILWLQLLCNGPIAIVAFFAACFFAPSSFLGFLVISGLLAFPALMLSDALFITPRVRRALESREKPSA